MMLFINNLFLAVLHRIPFARIDSITIANSFIYDITSMIMMTEKNILSESVLTENYVTSRI